MAPLCDLLCLSTSDSSFTPGTGVVYSEAIAIHTIDLSKFDERAGLQSNLDRWSFFLNNAAMLDSEALPTALAEPDAIRQAQAELNRIAQTPQEREAYESRVMRLRDDRARLLDAENRGILIGEIRRLQGLLQMPLASIESLRTHDLPDLQKLFADLERLASTAR